MNLGEMHTEVKTALKRGTSLDAEIPGYVRRAALFMERNYTFAYMKQFLLLEIDISVASTPRYVEIGAGPPKSIPLFRWNIDGEYFNVNPVDPADQDELLEGTPEAYWLDGVKRLVLDRTPDEDLSGELQIIRYTPWPTVLSFEHWLLERAEDVIIGQSLMFASIQQRDPRMKADYKEMRDEGLRTLLLAEDELLYAGRDERLEYLPAN